MSDLPPTPPLPIRELQHLLRLLDVLDSAAAPAPSSLLRRGEPGIPGSFGPPPTFGRQPPHSILNRNPPHPAPQVIVYDLSSIPPQDCGLLLIATHLSGGPSQTSRRSRARPEVDWSQRGLPHQPRSDNINLPRRSNALRRRQSRRELRREPWTLEGLGLGRLGIHNRAGLRPEDQGALHNRVADIMDAAVADVGEGKGSEPVVSMSHWDSGRR